MLSTASCEAQSFRLPFLELVVLDTSATSTGSSSTVASKQVMVKMQIVVTKAERSRWFW